MKTTESCPVCQNTDATCQHGLKDQFGPVHLWDCPECGESLAAILYDCPQCAEALGQEGEHDTEEAHAALRAEVKDLRQALAGLLGLVRDTIATADDLHEVHAADAALTRVDGAEEKEVA